MGIVVFIRSVQGRFEEHLGILDILGMEDILDVILDLYAWFIQRG